LPIRGNIEQAREAGSGSEVLNDQQMIVGGDRDRTASEEIADLDLALRQSRDDIRIGAALQLDVDIRTLGDEPRQPLGETLGDEPVCSDPDAAAHAVAGGAIEGREQIDGGTENDLGLAEYLLAHMRQHGRISPSPLEKHAVEMLFECANMLADRNR
jgi:hypothetical protein